MAVLWVTRLHRRGPIDDGRPRSSRRRSDQRTARQYSPLRRSKPSCNRGSATTAAVRARRTAWA